MSSEEAEQSADPAAPEEQKETEVEEEKVEKVEVAGHSEENVEDEAPQEQSHEETEEQSEGQDAETTEAESGEETEETESEESRKYTIDDIKTAPVDFRFPTTNQARHCFTRYVEYHKCVQIKGEDNPDCDKYARYYRSLCPGEWIDKWNEDRENGTFAGPL